jgi:hypothetical protein
VVVVAIAVLGTQPVLAQRVIQPNDLKVNPTKYKNSYVEIHDVFMNFRTGWPQAFIEAGYTQSKYIGFAVRMAGMGCFMRRSAPNEEAVAQIRPGDKVTVKGYVKEPKLRGRVETRKLNYIIEANSIEKGWPASPAP